MGSKALDLLERTGVTLGIAFLSALIAADMFDVDNVTDVSLWGSVAFAVVVAGITLATSALKNLTMPHLPAVLDALMRVVMTFVQTFLGAMLLSATDLSGFVNVDALQAAALAAVAAALSNLKGLAVVLISSNSTASLLPAKDDPTLPGEHEPEHAAA